MQLRAQLATTKPVFGVIPGVLSHSDTDTPALFTRLQASSKGQDTPTTPATVTVAGELVAHQCREYT